MGVLYRVNEHAVCEVGQRRARLSIASEHRGFHLSCWSQGVVYGSGWAPSPAAVADALFRFVSGASSCVEMVEAHPWFSADSWAHHERGAEAYVGWKWGRLLERFRSAEREVVGLPELVEAAFRKEELRRLFPFTSLYLLCFSRCTGYPFTNDCPSVCPDRGGQGFVVFGSNLGSGVESRCSTAETAIEQLVRLLPPGLGAAVHGTSESIPPL